MNRQEIIHKQFIEYSDRLKVVEKEIIRKYKANEDCTADVKIANGLKLMKEEAARMMVRKAY